MNDRALVDGLTVDERVARLEGTVNGARFHQGLVEQQRNLAERLEQLEHVQRQRELGWFGRLLLRVPFRKER